MKRPRGKTGAEFHLFDWAIPLEMLASCVIALVYGNNAKSVVLPFFPFQQHVGREL